MKEIQDITLDYINQTDQCIFLTGKAGTGKTTFLRNLKSSSYKNIIIAAPTGIAAINAGGVTLHSLFHLPFGCFMPIEEFTVEISLNEKISTPRSLLAKLQMNRQKRQLLRELDLLVIDEVSMLRADLLDAIDTLLRNIRKKPNIEFGGVQILFIGDLLQLPPVVKPDEWSLLRNHYQSPFFFEAKVLQDNPPVYIEFEKIFRQSDEEFIDILNRFRTNEFDEEDLHRINTHYQENYDEYLRENYIFLTTHNRKADKLNSAKLEEIEEELFEFYAKTEGIFNESAYPNEFAIQLKKGAQVMFIKNDTSDPRRYFNGKIGIITYLDNDTIEVSFENEDDPVIVNKYKWENKSFSLNKKTNEIEEKLLGTFEQYPLKLAWAITVHKSQGLTFEKAILDLTDSFANGQIYVALSRLTSLKGLVLSSLIPARYFMQIQSLERFQELQQSDSSLERSIDGYRRNYLKKFSQRVFMFDQLIHDINTIMTGKNKTTSGFKKWCRKELDKIYDLQNIGNKFSRQIENIILQEEYLPQLSQRIKQAQQYYSKQLDEILESIQTFKKQERELFNEGISTKPLNEIRDLVLSQHKRIEELIWLISNIENEKPEELNESRSKMVKELYPALSEKKSMVRALEKKEKTPSHMITFQMHKDGLSIEKIAEERDITFNTVFSHIAQLVEAGELKAHEFISEEKMNNILIVANTLESPSKKEIKEKLGDEYSWEDIKIALADLNHKKKD